MTCVAAIKYRGKVWVCADSASSMSGCGVDYRADPKVFRVGPFVIGGTTSWRMLQLLRFGEGSHTLATLKPPAKKDPLKFMVRKFVPRVRKIFKEAKFMHVKDGKESGGYFIVAWGNHLFCVVDDFQVAETLDDYCAVGCGHEFAKGALFLSETMVNPSDRMRPEARLTIALEAAAHHSCYVAPPFKTLKT